MPPFIYIGSEKARNAHKWKQHFSKPHSFMRPFGLPFVKIRKCKAAVGMRMERRGLNY